MKKRANITYAPLSGITPEQARDARARAWAFVFKCYDRHVNGSDGTPCTTPEDEKEMNNGPAESTLPPKQG
jgi:hypothetical protein